MIHLNAYDVPPHLSLSLSLLHFAPKAGCKLARVPCLNRGTHRWCYSLSLFVTWVHLSRCWRLGGQFTTAITFRGAAIGAAKAARHSWDETAVLKSNPIGKLNVRKENFFPRSEKAVFFMINMITFFSDFHISNAQEKYEFFYFILHSLQ